MVVDSSTSRSPLATLRQFARPQKKEERCELCGKTLAPEHQHLIEPGLRKLACCCDACAILFDDPRAARYKRVPRRIKSLDDFCVTDVQWEGLHLPIDLAFFYHSSVADRVVAVYPSPAGATESLLKLDAWQEIVAANPVLAELSPDVEALLVNRVGQQREYWYVPIDECFKLVGLIRIHWRGLSGGTEVWREIAAFSASLKNRSVSTT